MAVTAEFRADTSSFVSEVKKADDALEKLGTTSGTTSTQTSKMNDVMSTAAGVFAGITLDRVIGEIISLGMEAFATADKLVTLSARTDISIERLQQLGALGDDTSVSLDSIANGINAVQEKLGKGDKGVTAALAALNISLEDFVKLDAGQQFIALANAMKEIKDPIEFARIASELFGKNWKQLAPALKQGFDEAAQASKGMGTTSAKALDDFGDKWGASTRWLKVQWAEAMADIVTGTTSAFRAAQDAYTTFVNGVVAAAPKLKLAEPIIPPGLPADLDAITAKFDEQAKQITEKNSPAMKAYHDALAALGLAGTGWVKVLDTIDGKVVAAVKYYLEAGVSQNDLATAYGLTATQIAAVEKARQNELAGLGFEESAKKRLLEIQGLTLKATNDQVVANLKAKQAAQEALDAELAAALKAEEWWSKVEDKTKKVTEETKKVTKETGVYMNQLHMLIDDPKIAAFFGGGPQGAVATTLYSGGQAGITPEMAAAMAAGQFIRTAGVGAVHINISQPLGTPQAIAAAVGNALMPGVKQGAKLSGS